MKTLLFHIDALLSGGIEKVLIELLNGLDPAKYNIKLSIAHYMGDLEVLKSRIPQHVAVSYVFLSPILTNGKKKKVLKTITLPEKIFENILLPAFKKKVQEKKLERLVEDVDVVIDFDMTLAGYTKLFLQKKKVAYCHFSFDHYWGGDKKKLGILAQRLGRYDKVIMLCDEMINNAVEKYPFLKNNTVRIYNALDLRNIKALSEKPFDSDYAYLLQQGYFISAGRLTESQKDFTMLIKGYSACVKKYGILESLVILGDGPSRPVLEKLAGDEGIKDRVTFTGYRENPYNWIRNSKLFLFCSKFEGLPTVLIEALSLSCPIIATATPTGVTEILMDGKSGMLIKPGDIDGLCEAIHTLSDNAALQQTYINNARGMLEKFEIDYMVSQFEKLVLE